MPLVLRALLGAMLLVGCAASPPPVSSADTTPASPIYRESLEGALHPRYFFSTRTQEEAARNGWQQLGIAFYAYSLAVPGSIPVYCETPISAPHSDYRFSTEPEAAAREDGWMRLYVAFYAFGDARPGLVPIHAETPSADANGPHDYSSRDPIEARGFGWEAREIAFYAVDARLFDRERAD
jgi:hypothetical protein